MTKLRSIQQSLWNTPVWLRPIQSCNLRKGKGLQNKIVEAPVLWNRQLCGKAEQTRTYETSGGKDDIVMIHSRMEQGAIIWFSDLQIIPLLVMNFKIFLIVSKSNQKHTTLIM